MLEKKDYWKYLQPLTLNARNRVIWTLTATLAVSLFFAWHLFQIQFTHQLKDFFPANSPETEFYLDYSERFGGDSEFIFIGIGHRNGIFDSLFLNQVNELTHRLTTIPEITLVNSPTRVKELVRDPLGTDVLEIPWLNISQPEMYEADSIRIFTDPLLPDYLFAKNGKSVLLDLRHSPDLDAKACEQLSDTIIAICKEFTFEQLSVVGKCHGQTIFIRTIQDELFLFTLISLAIIILFLYLTYRSFWGVVLPLVIVGLALLWTVGFMSASGKPFDIVSNIIPTILMVIGLSDVVHLLTNYLQQIHLQATRRKALLAAVKEVGLATILTTLTTAIGFLSLTTSSFTPLVELGFYSTVGLLAAFLLTYIILPSAMVLLPQVFEKMNTYGHNWERGLHFAFNYVISHPRSILVGSGLILIFGIGGISQLEVHNFMLDDVKADHPHRKDFTFFAENYSGVRPFEMQVQVIDTSKDIFSAAILHDINRVDSFLIHNYGVKSLISPAVMVKYAHQIYQRGKADTYVLPQSRSLLNRLSRQIKRESDKLPVDKFYSNDGQTGRISGKVPDWGSIKARKKNEALTHFIEKELQSNHLKFHMTGSVHLMDLNNSYLAENVIWGLVAAIFIIGGLLGFLLKSLNMVWIALVPNLLPLVFIGGIMGYAGINLKISTSIIFIISFGIAVDDSIHFLSRFRREIREHDLKQALRSTYLTSGKAIVITTFILMGGFSVLCLSDFLGTLYLGLLVGLTLLIAVLADLTLLPVLLLKYYKK